MIVSHIYTTCCIHYLDPIHPPYPSWTLSSSYSQLHVYMCIPLSSLLLPAHTWVWGHLWEHGKPARGHGPQKKNDSPSLSSHQWSMWFLSEGWSLRSPCVPFKLADWPGLVQANRAATRVHECDGHVKSRSQDFTALILILWPFGSFRLLFGDTP